ncbi:MAG: helicase HerA-like domain-containing protein [Pseudomonadota bacterium]
MSSIFVGGGGADYGEPQELALDLANRHGLIAGATGTGKTVTMQILAEGFSAAGVPVFMADVKGDVSGLAAAGEPSDRLTKRAAQIGMGALEHTACPVVFWDLFGQSGHPVRTTVSELGPLLLARMLDLTEAQEGVLHIAFHIADDQGLALLDLSDLRSVLVWIGENKDEVGRTYGHVATASVGAIQRALLMLESEGAAAFLGEPALKLEDLMAVDDAGRGRVNVLMADRLITAPRLYAMFLLWLLSELFEDLSEVGNPEKPKLVFFFDEAHLLFETAPKSLITKIEQVVRLIRSKGVGVYFVSQLPDDVPDDVLSQLGNRIQHALRAFTPRDAKALKVAAETFRPNPGFDTATAIKEVGTGEAVVSLLEKKAVPGMVQRTLIRPPGTRMGPLEASERKAAMDASPLAGTYDERTDRRSAHEILAERAQAAAAEAETVPEPATHAGGSASDLEDLLDSYKGTPGTGRRYTAPSARATAKTKPGMASELGEAFARTMVEQLSTQRGRRMVRGVLGGLFKGR